MIKTFTLLVSLLTLTINCFAQNVWTQKASYPDTGVFGAIGFSIGDKGYIGCGQTYFFGFSYSFWEYDPNSDLWAQRADFPGGNIAGGYSFSIGSKGYVGEVSGDLALWEFDQLLNTWNRKSSVGESTFSGFAIGTKGYVFGRNSKFWEYDPILDSWTPKADFSALYGGYPVSFSIGNKGYIGTGLFHGSLDNLWEFDPSLNAWTQKANFPGSKRSDAVAFVIGGKGYIGTGQDSLNKWLSDFWEFDTTNNKWTQIANYGGGGISEAVGFAIGNKGYVGTGAPSSPPPSKTFWEYSPLVGVNNLSAVNSHVSVYPNPFSEEAIIVINQYLKDATLAIYNTYGQQVKEIKNISGQTVILHRDNLASGLYFLQLTQDDKIIATEKLIIVDH